MLPYVAHPCALIFAHSANKPTGLPVGASVVLQSWQRFDQAVDKGFAQACSWPLFQYSQVYLVTNDREMCIQARSNINVCGKNFHSKTFNS